MNGDARLCFVPDGSSFFSPVLFTGHPCNDAEAPAWSLDNDEGEDDDWLALLELTDGDDDIPSMSSDDARPVGAVPGASSMVPIDLEMSRYLPSLLEERAIHPQQCSEPARPPSAQPRPELYVNPKRRMVTEAPDTRYDPAAKNNSGRAPQQRYSAWRPRLHKQSARPVSSAPGASTTPAIARPVSHAPGALIFSQEARPASYTPRANVHRSPRQAVQQPTRLRTVVSPGPDRHDANLLDHNSHAVEDSSMVECIHSHVNTPPPRPVPDLIPATVDALPTAQPVPSSSAGQTEGHCSKDQKVPSLVHEESVVERRLVEHPAPNTLPQRILTRGSFDASQVPHRTNDVVSLNPAVPRDKPAHVERKADSVVGPPIRSSAANFNSDLVSVQAQDPAHQPVVNQLTVAAQFPEKELIPIPDPEFSGPSNCNSSNQGPPSFSLDAQGPSPPNFAIPGYNWVMHNGAWCLLPIKHDLTVSSTLNSQDISDCWANEVFGDKNPDNVEDKLGDTDVVPDTQLSSGSTDPNPDGTDDSDSDFVAKLRKIIHGDYSNSIPDPSPVHDKAPPEGTRRSERHKKPSTRWNEEAGYVAPKSAKKKGAGTSNISHEAPASKRAKLEELESTAKRSLTFLSSQAGDPPV